MRTITLSLALAACLLGQNRTKPVTTQVKAPPSSPTGTVLIVGSGGVLREATLDPSITLTGCPTACLLKAVAPAAQIQPRTVEVIVVSVPLVTTLTLVRVPSELDLLRNGIELSEGIDYTISGAVVTFLAGAEPTQGDTLRAKYK